MRQARTRASLCASCGDNARRRLPLAAAVRAHEAQRRRNGIHCWFGNISTADCGAGKADDAFFMTNLAWELLKRLALSSTSPEAWHSARRCRFQTEDEAIFGQGGLGIVVAHQVLIASNDIVIERWCSL